MLLHFISLNYMPFFSLYYFVSWNCNLRFEGIRLYHQPILLLFLIFIRPVLNFKQKSYLIPMKYPILAREND